MQIAAAMGKAAVLTMLMEMEKAAGYELSGHCFFFEVSLTLN